MEALRHYRKTDAPTNVGAFSVLGRIVYTLRRNDPTCTRIPTINDLNKNLVQTDVNIVESLIRETARNALSVISENINDEGIASLTRGEKVCAGTATVFAWMVRCCVANISRQLKLGQNGFTKGVSLTANALDVGTTYRKIGARYLVKSAFGVGGSKRKTDVGESLPYMALVAPVAGNPTSTFWL